jgi:hypothetical protein
MIDSLLVPRHDKCVLDSLPIAPVCSPCTQVASSPFVRWRSFAIGGMHPLGATLIGLRHLRSPTHANSQTLTKHVPFASVFSLLKWKQVMRLSFFFFLVRILIRVLSSRLLPAFIGSDLLTTTGRSAISQPIDSAFPLRLYLPYLVRVYVKETTRLPSVICTFYSIHPDPNHVDEPCRSYPLYLFSCKICLIA